MKLRDRRQRVGKATVVVIGLPSVSTINMSN
jgi:hypothetical protein